MMFTPEFWVAASFLILLAGFGYLGVHRKLAQALDERSARIRAELDEARRLKDEAAALLADYRNRQRQAEREAQEIIASAQVEAERMAAEAQAKMEEFVARRQKLAELKIAQAEVQALTDVRAAAAEAAAAAAERVLRDTVKGKVADDLMTQGIADVKKRLN
jgi:F-type H+-transporting ATPase subunit b